jgi:ABC-type branched-subunit amino acid transport system permease subunit
MTEPTATNRATVRPPAEPGPAAADRTATAPAGPPNGGPPGTAGASAHRIRRHDFVPPSAGVVILGLGILVLTALNGSYLGLTVTTGVAYAVVAVGMVLQLGYSRQLAFSQSVFMGVGGYGTGVLETKYNFGAIEALVVVIALAAVVSIVIGAVVTRAPGLALALATLLLPLFIYQLATFSSYLGSYSGISGVLPFWTGDDYESTTVRSGIVAVFLLALAAALVLRVMRSGIGLQLMAMSEDEQLGEALGVSLRQRRLEVFVVGSVLAAVGGAILASSQGLIAPPTLNESTQITLLLMVYVPGRRSIAGVILGAIVIEYLTTSAASISNNLGIIEGAVLLIVLLVEPDGLAGAIARLLGRRTDQWAGPLRRLSETRFRTRGGGGGARNVA